MASRPEKGFRIADLRRTVFDGEGALLFGGRWNSPGRRVIYAAETFACAMLETLVHTRIGKVPRSHGWIEFAIPDDLSVEILDSGQVPGWNAYESPSARSFGDDWYDSGRSLILEVPSVVTNGLTRNLLINQKHRDSRRLLASKPRRLEWDARLFPRR